MIRPQSRRRSRDTATPPAGPARTASLAARTGQERQNNLFCPPSAFFALLLLFFSLPPPTLHLLISSYPPSDRRVRASCSSASVSPPYKNPANPQKNLKSPKKPNYSLPPPTNPPTSLSRPIATAPRPLGSCQSSSLVLFATAVSSLRDVLVRPHSCLPPASRVALLTSIFPASVTELPPTISSQPTAFPYNFTRCDPFRHPFAIPGRLC
jgi:hypothetical protein